MITAVLITWKRQHNLPAIIDSLLKEPLISEIIIRDNSKCKNIMCYGRFTSAKKAKNNYIYTQDDDCIVKNIGGVIDSFIRQPDRISYSGIDGYEEKIPDTIFGTKQLALLGWGSVFDRRWISVLDKYIAKYGKDECFYSETDRLFSLLLNKHHNFVAGGVTHLEGKDDENAMCQRPNHLSFKETALERALTL